MNSHYKNSKEVAKDIRDKIVELKPFDTLGVFVLCAFLSFPYFFVGAMSLALIDLIFEMMKLDVSLLNLFHLKEKTKHSNWLRGASLINPYTAKEKSQIVLVVMISL